MILRNLFAMFMTFAIALPVLAFREVRNGGGGTRVDGRYLTFHSAKIAADTVPEEALKIPGLQTLTKVLLQLPVEAGLKGDLLRFVMTSTNRKYFKVGSDVIFEEERKKIIQEYSKLMDIPEKDVVIFAVTSPEAQGTLLLPEFYSLSETEQAAILLHESLWIWKPESTYRDIVNAEMSFQAYAENQFAAEPYYNVIYNLSKLNHTPSATLHPAFVFDIDHGVIGASFGENKRVLAKDLLGEHFLAGLLRQESLSLPFDHLRDQSMGLMSELPLLTAARPSSMFYKALWDFLQQEKTCISISNHIPEHIRRSVNTDFIDVGFVRFMDDAEFEKYLQDLYIDISKPASFRPLQYNLVLGNGTLVGRLIFHDQY